MLAKLGDVANVYNGKTPARSEQRDSGHPVLKIRDVDEFGNFRGEFNSFVDKAFVNSHSAKKIMAGDIFILNAAHNADYVGSKTFFATGEVIDALPTGEWTIIRTTANQLLPKYFYFWLSSNYGKTAIKQIVRGIHLYPTDVANINIPLPPLPEQERIVRLLDEAESLRATRQRSNVRMEQFVPALFQEMFGDPIINSKNWKIFKLDEIAKIERGRFSPRPRNNPKFYGGIYPFVQTGDIASSNDYLTTWTQTLNELGIKVSKCFDVGTILIAIVGATIGETTILGVKTYCPDSAIGIMVNPEITTPEYVEFVLRYWKPIFRAQAPKTARANINLGTLRPVKIPLPPLALQREFAARVEEARGVQSAQRKSAGKAEALYQSMLSRAFAGEL